ncbi:MAG: hypothetical protein HFE67_08325 [Erysipelotrichaceae bacterium]|nr:hypothetical protein [Erysipelotrichaceae bacterium]
MKEIMAKEEGIQMAEKRIAESMDDKKLFHEIMSDIKRYCDEEQRMMIQEELEKETQLRKQAEKELNKFQLMVEKMRSGMSYEDALTLSEA